MKHIRISFIVLFISIFSCTYRDIPRAIDCSTSDLSIVLNTKLDPSGCSTTEGSITVTAIGGKQPYTYSINGAFLANNVFGNLGSGDYSIIVKDANECQQTLSVSLISAATTLGGSATITDDSGCSVHNGTINVTATAGFPPYQYQLNNGGYGSASSFIGLSAGSFTVSIRDSKGCVKTISATVAAVSTISYASDVAPLLNTYCNLPGCHGAGTGGRDWTTHANVKANATAIKSRTANRSMPQAGSPTLTQAQIDLIGCWVGAGALNN